MSSPLARRLGLFSLIVYGIGDILGAGIYALVGKVASAAGSGAWISFLLASAVALVTGLSYAELSSRFPVSAGAAAYVAQAFKGRLIATLTGVTVMGTGLVSAATVSVAFSNYLGEFLAIPPLAAQCILVFALSFLSFWGILESARVNLVLTAVEFLGLIAVIVVGTQLASGESMNRFWESTVQSADAFAVLGGVTLAFFAFIGFEDLCNLAEEAKNPARDLPKAILTAIAVSTVLYLAVIILLQITLTRAEIESSATPLLILFEKGGLDWVVRYFSVIAMLAIANTGLANLIMASRLVYGMSNQGLLPKAAGKVHAQRQTPWVGVVFAGAATLILVLTGGLQILAQTTGLLISLVFLMVHLSLLQVKRKKKPHSGITLPVIFPLIGVLLCLGLIFHFPAGAFLRSLIVLAIGLGVWILQKNGAKAAYQ